MGVTIDRTNQRFGRLLVVRRKGLDKHKHATWVCACDCGDTMIASARNLASGNTTSCGCKRKEILIKMNTTHGATGAKTHGTWLAMRKRCLNKKNKNYKNYGGRGITICKEWLDSFDPKVTQTTHETTYKVNGLKLRLTLIPKKTLKKAPIVSGHMLPARWIGTDQLRNMIAGKIKKYKSVKEFGLYFVIALNITNMPAGERGLLDELFGKLVVSVMRNKDGDVVSVEERRDFSGLLTPKPGLGGRAQNTRLSAVLNVVSKWLERQEESEPARRVHFFRVIHNYWASNRLDYEVFRGYPQFVNISENQRGISFGWVDEGNDKPFDC